MEPIVAIPETEQVFRTVIRDANGKEWDLGIIADSRWKWYSPAKHAATLRIYKYNYERFGNIHGPKEG